MKALEKEKNSIRLILPKVVHELEITRASIDGKNREVAVLDSAIQEIEDKFGHVLFTSDFFSHSAEA